MTRSFPAAEAVPLPQTFLSLRGIPRRALALALPALVLGPVRGRTAETLPLSEAVARVAARYEGRLLDARLVPGRPPEGTDLVYELRWLTPAGDVLRARVDARTGDMVEVDGPGQFAARRPGAPGAPR